MPTIRSIKTKLLICVLILLSCRQSVNAQINFTANDAGHVPAYNTPFLYGTNGGYYYSWDDKSLADIAAGNPSKNVKGVGSKTFRPSLPDSFVVQYGYNIRLNEFAYYASLGVQDNTVMLGGDPTVGHRDSSYYEGCDQRSLEFKNLYEPIWDNGENGTPVNENNYFASYVYQVVTRYKPYVKFWEIVNEPDQTGAAEAWYQRGQPGNWWENNPSACQLKFMYIPIFYYIRMLRIGYEVVKSIDPNAYVAPGGLAYISFLDALLRNTDDPAGGAVSSAYPFKGGAYFDVLSFHSYPMYDLKTWDNTLQQQVWRRHSDAAADLTMHLKESMDSILVLHGYNGSTYPKKVFICTEANVASKPLDYLMGSADAQKNYIPKVFIESQQHDIKQMYIYQLGNVINSWETPVQIHDVMGLYDKLANIGPINVLGLNTGIYLQQYTSGGIAFKTCSDLLIASHYNAARTGLMNLPANVGGATFTDNVGNHTYILWARTKTDNSEVTSATYSFPAAMSISPQLNKKNWDYAVTGAISSILPSNIALTGEPVYLTEDFTALPLPDPDSIRNLARPEKKFAVSLYPNPASSATSLQFTLTSPATVQVSVYDASGKWIMDAIASRKFSTGTHSVSLNTAGYLLPGIYYCRFQTNVVQVMKKLVIVK